MENFCTCKTTSCKLHPSNHNEGCSPCIKKNLALEQLPNCYFNLVTEDKSKIKGYGLKDFAQLVLDELK